MKKIMYEVNWHCTANEKDFLCATVTPIIVIREDVLPGCSLISITAIDHKGGQFNGYPRDYFNTEQEAWDYVKQCLRDKIEQLEKEIAEKQNEIDVIKKFLSTHN